MLVVATAGHVDHGKSTLVRALTGMEPDRWAEERRRGMTIDLGYAWTDDITFVDVPGHERFVANMLAGVGPVPAALLVIAADSGWSAQTEEHWQALRMLDVAHGVVAVTRSDLCPAQPVAEDAQRRTCWPVVVVSAVTGEGLDELRVALARLASAVGPAADTGRPRLWVDRAFSLPGAGPVVTGTLSGGSLRPGDEVLVGALHARVTGVQSRGIALEVASPGTRVALRLRGVRRDDLARGMALTRPGDWLPSTDSDVELTEPGRAPDRAVLHLGSAAVAVRVRRLDDRFVRLSASSPLPLQMGDRGLLRDAGGRGLISGVVVVEPDPPPLDRRRGAAVARAQSLATTGLLRRRRTIPAATLAAWGCVLPPGAVEIRGWVCDPAWVDQTRLALSARPDDTPISELVAALGLPSPDFVGALQPRASSDATAANRAETRLRELPAPFTLAQARDALGLSRSGALALLEELDQRGRTVRRPDGSRAWVREVDAGP